MLHLKYKTEDCWIAAVKLEKHPSPNRYRHMISVMKKEKMPEVSLVENFLSLYEDYLKTFNIEVDQYDNLSFTVPSNRSTARLSSAFTTDSEINSLMSRSIELFDSWAVVKPITTKAVIDTAKKHSLRFQYNETSSIFTPAELDAMRYLMQDYWLKDMGKLSSDIKKCQALISKGLVEPIEQRVENAYIQKSAWAIFAEINGSSGYIDKAGKVGEISAARLFDSERDAFSTGKRKSLDGFDVMQVSISLQKRCSLMPGFQNKKMLETLSYMEREKIDNLISEIGEDKLSEVLQKRKTHKL